MKRRIVSILLIAMMVLGTFSISVFALEEVTPAQTEGTTVVEGSEGVTPEVTEPTAPTEGETPVVDENKPEGEVVEGEPTEEVKTEEEPAVETQEGEETPEPVALATPTEFATYSAYQSVALEWRPVEHAASYDIMMDGNVINTAGTAAYDGSGKLSFVWGGLGDEGTHTFAVRAKAASGSTEYLDSAWTAAIADSPVRQMYIWFKFKSKAKLKSHDGMKVKHTFNKNEWVRAHGFGGGKYKFYYNGNLFYSSYLRTKGAWCDYQKGSAYDRKEAEYFINTSGTGSATPWYLWVNQNTQHVYLLYGSAGNFRVYDDWICSTGAAKTPSPTGFNKKIYKRVKKRNGHGPWTAFQSWTSFHGSRKSWAKKWGNPASHACIRCPNEKAQFIYHNIPNGTCVSVF